MDTSDEREQALGIQMEDGGKIRLFHLSYFNHHYVQHNEISIRSDSVYHLTRSYGCHFYKDELPMHFSLSRVGRGHRTSYSSLRKSSLSVSNISFPFTASLYSPIDLARIPAFELRTIRGSQRE